VGIDANVGRPGGRAPSTASKLAAMAFAIAAMLIIAPPAGAAKPPKPAPLAATEGVTGVLVGGAQTELVPITVTATTKGKGLALIRIPHQTDPRDGQDFEIGRGDGHPQPQTTDSALSGYVRVSTDSCTSASLVPVTPVAPGGDVELVVQYRCEAGQQFTVYYYPRIDWWNFTYPVADVDTWTFSLSRRASQDEPWTELSTQALMQVSPVTIQQPPLLYTAPPAPLTEVVVDNLTGNLILTLQGFNADGTKIQAQVPTTNYITLDGAPLVIVNADPLRSINQPPLEVRSCIANTTPELCQEPNAFGTVSVTAPPGTFTHQDGTSYTGSAYADALAPTVSYAGWDYAEQGCVSASGAFHTSPSTTPAGQGPTDWWCEIIDSQAYWGYMSLAQLTELTDRLSGAAYCPSRLAYLEFDSSNSFDRHHVIWCERV
jgi:hypothetical protein